MNDNDRFEIEVADMLSDKAKVDRSTVELTRASIDSLPLRNPRPAFGVRLSMPGLPVGWRRTFALLGVAGVVVALLAASLYGRFQTAPLAPGSARPSAAQLAPGCAAASPAGAASVSAATPFVHSNKVLSVVGWAPDGSSVAVIEQPKSIGVSELPTATVDLFSRTGVDEGTVETWEFGWLDATNYAILRNEQLANGMQTSHAYLGRVGSTDLVALPGTYESLLAGPSGAVALLLPWDQTLASPPQYVVISGGKMSALREGSPVAWSRDGGLLAVVHVTKVVPPPDGAGGNSATTGWLEVVRASGESVVSARDVETTILARAIFSPDGARLAFDELVTSATNDSRVGVLEVSSGRLSVIPTSGLFTWVDSTELLLEIEPSVPISKEIVSWSATSGQLTQHGPGSIVGSSGLGLVIVDTGCPSELSVAQWADGSPVSVGTIPPTSWQFVGMPDAAWSPDGKSLILIFSEIRSDGTSGQMSATIAHF